MHTKNAMAGINYCHPDCIDIYRFPRLDKQFQKRTKALFKFTVAHCKTDHCSIQSSNLGTADILLLQNEFTSGLVPSLS